MTLCEVVRLCPWFLLFYIPDDYGKQAWDDLIGLTQDKEYLVQNSAAYALVFVVLTFLKNTENRPGKT